MYCALTPQGVLVPNGFVVTADAYRYVLERAGAWGKLHAAIDGLDPNNIQDLAQLDAFAQLFDGFSIGSNDLTQLTLGVDRDSALVAGEFDERDPGVLELIRQTVEGARRNHRHCGMCGQAPSDYPDVAEYLVRLGIDSISLNPDSLLKTTLHVLQLEETLGRQCRGPPGVRVHCGCPGASRRAAPTPEWLLSATLVGLEDDDA
jgi:phosphoenolpyruvate synthase/pyruvate phosphate dikinase